MEVRLQERTLARRLRGIGLHCRCALIPQNGRIDPIHRGVRSVRKHIRNRADPVVPDWLVGVDLSR